ncbi:hypothetical protein [Amorphus sp. 3PC139-8]|uniref:hypothetical protein n=1 Tax=Amorphus sp. 3PC139-8 TaxID=2735676 RepID=UPI00345DDB14
MRHADCDPYLFGYAGASQSSVSTSEQEGHAPMVRFAVTSFFVIATSACVIGAPEDARAQNAEGKLSDWSGGAVDVMNWALTGPPAVIGSIGEDGAIRLHLPDTVDAKQPLSQLFSCSDGSVTSNDPDAEYFITSPALMVGSVAKKQLLGTLIAATNRDAAAARAGRAPIAAGRYYQWLYTPDTVTIEGDCRSDVFPDGTTRVEVTTTYAMTLEPGWTILEVEMAEVETSSKGFAVARDLTFRTLDALPAEAQWFYWPE